MHREPNAKNQHGGNHMTEHMRRLHAVDRINDYTVVAKEGSAEGVETGAVCQVVVQSGPVTGKVVDVSPSGSIVELRDPDTYAYR